MEVLDLLEMLKKEEEMLSAVKERQMQVLFHGIDTSVVSQPLCNFGNRSTWICFPPCPTLGGSFLRGI